jgi:hypothetical protein
MGQQVGAVAVVVVVRHHLADLVQAQAQPSSRRVSESASGMAASNSASASPATRAPASCRHRKAPLQFGHRSLAHVLWPATLRRVQALLQVDHHTLAQRALGGPEFVDAEVRGQRVQDGQAAGQHGAAVGRRPGRSMRSAWPACRQRSMHQRRPLWRDAAVGLPAACSSCDTAPAVPEEPSAWVQFWGAKGCRAFLEFGAGGHLGLRGSLHA